MPAAIIPVIGAVAGAVAGQIAGSVFASIAIKIAIGVALSYAAKSLAKKPKTPTLAPLANQVRSRTEMVRQPIAPHRVIYGKVMVSGPIVYAEAFGPPTISTSDLTFLVVFCAHQIESFEEWWLIDRQVTLSANAVQEDRFRSDSAPATPLAYIYEHDGDPDQQVDQTLVALTKAFWGVNHRLRGLAYAHLKLTYDEEVWRDGAPKLRAVIKGKKVYDPRTALTAWSENPALCLRDYLTSYLGIASADIDDDSVIAAANVCEESVALDAGGTEDRYTANGMIRLDQEPIEVIGDLCGAMAGELTFSGGKFRVYAGEADASALTIDEDDLVGGIRMQPRRSRSELINRAKAIYVDPDQAWQATTAPPITNSTYESEDNGTISEETIELPFTTSSPTAQRLAKIQLERMRQQITATIRVKPRVGWRVQVWDVVAVDNDRFGWSAKLFRITNWRANEDLTVTLTLREEAAAVWSWSAEETVYDPAPDTILPDPFTIPAPGGFTFDEELTTTATGAVLTRVIVTVNEVPAEFITRYEMQWKRNSESNWRVAGNHSGTVFDIIGLEDGVQFDVRARAINALGRPSAWATGAYTPTGQTAPPEDVTNFNVNIVGSVAHLSWDPVSDVDLSHYRMRWATETTGASWGGSIDLVPRVGRPATSADVPAQIGTWLIKAVDLVGNESVNAVSIASTIGVFDNLNLIETITEDPAFAGTNDNTASPDNVLQLDTSVLFDSVAGDFDDTVGEFDGGGGTGNVATSGTYTFAGSIDLGGKFTSRITADLTVGARDYADTFDAAAGSFDDRAGLFDGETPSKVNVELQVRTTNDDPAGSPTWSAWQRLIVGAYSARAFQFRAVLTTLDTSASPTVSALSVTVDMEDVVKADNDVVADAGGEAIVFSPAFKALGGVSIAAQDLATGDYWTITSKSATGFTIQFRNSGGTGVQRTFDWVAKGYGQVAA